MSLHKVKGKMILDLFGDLDKTMCEDIIEKMIKQCEKIETYRLNWRKYHHLVLGFMNNEIKMEDKIYVTYDFREKQLKIYEIDWKFLYQVKKLKQKLKNIPRKPGIYILECGKFIYIGESVDIRVRLIEHYIGIGSQCTQNNEITSIKQIFPIKNYPNYENIVKKRDYEAFFQLKQQLLFCEKSFISLFRSMYSPELINPR